ncbi:Kinesin domain-containing protein/Malectin domain-containing protein [Cephalotus follicularis]|uniref:Kinesin domain-containing protein/Malectin domain-containing protein n=1 Tax=Cephalotus follicularis TaxID=3775 RepID=A0A1Q3BKN8_CEPFO|nr:Kinesin domain-containing protein/Malectin domain-containing protein [Cephalotus follicularis]
MEIFQLDSVRQDPETLISKFTDSRVFEWEKDMILNQESKDPSMDEDVILDQESKDSAMDEESLIDSMLCDSGSKLIRFGFTRPNCRDEEVLLFVNAGGEALIQPNCSIKILADTHFEGGNVLRTDEHITEAGDYQFIYQSARLGNFCYRFDDFPPGHYFVDLHFAEIINTNGPKGIRVFNVYIQEERVLSDFDIFAVVGSNKPLQLVDSRVSVKENGVIVIRFEGVIGSPAVSGICIRRAPNVSVPHVSRVYFKCDNCAAEIEVSSAQKKLMRTKATDNYEKKIQELTFQFQHKTNECHEAWMSLTTANEQLEKVRMELDNKTFQARSLEQTVGKEAESLRNITSRYECDKTYWAMAVHDLQKKIKKMKEEHFQLSREAHECADSIPELSKMVVGVQALVTQCEDLKLKYSEEQAKRKELYNQIQETKGNIRVFCRCRPLSKEEISARYATVVDFNAAKDGDLAILTGGSTKRSFKFDRVYTPKDNQVDVFADASPVVISVLDGYNVCIFAYGQTGTGKTFTMEGTEQNRGVNYRTLEQLFEVAKERRESFKYDISVSVLEVYNEQIRDLLATSSSSSKKLEIKQSSEGFHHVPGIVEAMVDNTEEVWNVLQLGSNARAVGSNNVNEHSSRSHCMLCIMVKAKNLMSGECTNSKLWLVDLAGSERLAKTDVQGERLKEAQNINRSLSALGDVIFALATKTSHVPYRNSKLTHLLQDSLGGDSKTLMFVQISPSEKDLSETLSSLNFATRVRGVELGPAKKQIDTSELQKMKVMLDKARQEARSKDESLRKLEETMQNLESKAKGKDHIYKSQLEKIKELEGQLELKTTLHCQSDKQLAQLVDRLKGREESCSGLQQKVNELETKLRERQLSESTTFQQKVEDLEKKLKEQVQESDSHSLILQFKVKELERKLREKEQESLESIALHQKIKELEDKLREQEQQLMLSRDLADVTKATPNEGELREQEQQTLESSALNQKIKELEDKVREQELQLMLTRDFANVIKATPNEGKPRIRDELMSDIEPRILRSSNSINRPMCHGSTLPGGNDLLHDTRKKRQSRSGETENYMAVPTHLNDKKARKSDPPKIAKVARPAKLVTTTTQGPPTKKRISRDSAQGTKERDVKKKIWSR